MTVYNSPRHDPRDLQLYGPRLRITIGHPLLYRGKSIQSTTTDALIDTGAQRTIIDPEVVERVGLSKIDETTLIRVGSETRADVYAASLQFPRSGLSTVEMIAVPCCKLPQPLFRCLIGRDVLSRWIFQYDGPLGAWHLSEETGPGWVEPPEGMDPSMWGDG